MTDFAPALLALTGGFAVGLFHFASLKFCVDAFAAGNAARAILLQLGRFAVTGAAFVVFARLGALPLLAAALGLLIARALLVRRERARQIP